MLFHHLVIAIRNLRRHALHTFINLAGLTVGLVAFLLILLFVVDEWRHDRFHEDADRIVRVTREWKNQDGTTNLHLGAIAPPFLPLMRTQLGDAIEASTRILSIPNALLSVDDRHFQESSGVMSAEAEFFSVFTFPLIHGDAMSALAEPNLIALTESAAKRYFGTTDVIGRTMILNGNLPLQVSAVMADVPAASHFTFHALISFKTVENLFGATFMATNYGSNNYYTYVKLREGVSPTSFEARLPDLMDGVFPADASGQKASKSMVLHVWPLTTIYLHSKLDSELGTNGDIAVVWIYGLVAAFILAIACINFMNLSTARYGDRMREIGVRKALGADRMHLIRQFLGESVLMVLIAFTLAVLMLELCLPAFNSFTGKAVELGFAAHPWIIPALLALAIGVGLVAGSYPALFLSSFDANAILKGELTVGKGPERFRSALVVTQFAITIGLIAAVGIVSAQMEYIRKKDLGLKTAGVFHLPANPDMVARFPELSDRWRSVPGIADVSLASRVPSGRLLDSQGGQTEIGGEFMPIPFRVADVHVSHDFIRTFGMEVVAGRDFDPMLASDSLEAFILNETAVRRIGWASAEEAVGKRFLYGNRSGAVVGVVKDHHFENLRQAVSPIVFMITSGRASSVGFRVLPGREQEVLTYLEAEWAYLRPNRPFTPTFLDEAYASQYVEENRLGILFAWFAGLAALIAGMGLFGLAAFTVQRRMKEIGIRKILGADTASLVTLLTARFMRWILFSALVAIPVAWFGMERWLDSFAYRSDITAGPFLAALSAAVLVTALTVSSHTLAAALANPATVIRRD